MLVWSKAYSTQDDWLHWGCGYHPFNERGRHMHQCRTEGNKCSMLAAPAGIIITNNMTT